MLWYSRPSGAGGVWLTILYIIFDQLTQVPLCRKLVEMWKKPVDQVVYIRPNDTSII